MESQVAPVIKQYWAEDAFPFELVPGIRDLKISGAGYAGYECAGGSTLLAGFIAMESLESIAPAPPSLEFTVDCDGIHLPVRL